MIITRVGCYRRRISYLCCVCLSATASRHPIRFISISKFFRVPTICFTYCGLNFPFLSGADWCSKPNKLRGSLTTKSIQFIADSITSSNRQYSTDKYMLTAFHINSIHSEAMNYYRSQSNYFCCTELSIYNLDQL